MKTLFYSIILMSASTNCFAFPENLSASTISSIAYNPNQECPYAYCGNGDGGFSMRNWCEAHGSDTEIPDEILVGWTIVNGINCFCRC